MKITAIQCPKCKDIIYSRAIHDCRYCRCGEVCIDGGLYYERVGFKSEPPKRLQIEIDATKEELYEDWNFGKDKFGLIKPKEDNK